MLERILAPQIAHARLHGGEIQLTSRHGTKSGEAVLDPLQISLRASNYRLQHSNSFARIPGFFAGSLPEI
jgi:hypothetical protein